METALKKFLSFLIFAIIIGGAVWKQDALLSVIGIGGEERSAPPARGSVPVKVITQPVEITSNNRTFRAVGTGRARLSVEIYPSVAEEVTDVFFKARQEVKKGDVLVQLDDREEVLTVRLAEVRLKDAQSLLNRYEQAVKEGGVPQSEVDAARASFEGAQVALEQAKLALEERRIKAPFDGIVGIPGVDPGDRVGTDTLITGLDARDILYVDFEVPEALAGALQNTETQSRKITATTPAYLSLNFSGHISAHESRFNPERRTLMARASIDNSDDFLRPGMSFEMRWDIPGKDYATVPEISVQWGRDGSYIWLIHDGVAEKTPAKVVSRKAGRVLLEGNIKDSDSVVIEGLQRLRPGQKVEVVGSAEE
ncbi:MAG: efflux RND transporter periplasmic adaptor subunit [Alphaproteobacteria bacterium CG_4_9_14_3_um_filter_47_13]|nr:MAG: efflux RND transporter periplasmic adaptor subunit [Alphaproteobacteria bacterium CG_4_9_14_3_um_filter_47_13]